MGRHSKPAGMKVIQGTFRHDRDAISHPIPSSVPAEPPSYLLKEEKEFFYQFGNRLNEIGLNSSTYTEMMASVAMRTYEIAELSKIIEKDGMTYTTTSTVGDTVHKARPEIGQRSEAIKNLQALLKEFGLSPVSRTSIKIAITKTTGDDDNPYAKMSKR